MVVYFGDIKSDVFFDPAMLSAVFSQVKFKNGADMTAEEAIRPFGLFHDLSEPLPYLTLLFELGNESAHGATKSKIKVTMPTPTVNGEFLRLRRNWLTTVEALEDYQKEHPRKKCRDRESVEKQDKVKEERLAMDTYNRYTIAVHGASSSIYGILSTAKVETEFASLLATTMPSPTDQDETIQHMRLLRWLGSKSGHSAWMTRYLPTESEENLMDVGP